MQLNVKTVLCQTIQFSIVQFQHQKQFYFKQFKLAKVHSFVFYSTSQLGKYPVVNQSWETDMAVEE